MLAALTAVVLVGRALGWVLRAIGQPPVIGEILAGIALGHLLPGVFNALAALEYASVNLVVAVLIWAMVAFANRTRTRTRFAAA